MDGFNANFNYISGKNDMGIKVPMTAPVIFRHVYPQYPSGLMLLRC